MKGWQAAAGFLGVGTVISLLSLIGDTTSYDETKYKVAGHWADTTTETATVGGKRSKQASSDDGDDFVGENDGGTKLPPNAPSFKSKQAMLAALVGAGDSWGKRRTFAKMVMNLDNNVRKVVDALAAAKLLQNTVVAFASDNGGCPRDGGSNWPLRGTKFSQYEGGVRVPAFLWSSTLQKRGAGTVFEGLFHVADWFPTLVASAGVQATVGKIDGVNQYDALFDTTQDAPRDELLIHLNKWTPGADHAAVTAFDAAPAALRWKHWKLIMNEGPMVVNTPAMNASWCACSLTAHSSTSYLFNLANDKNESVDVRSDRPDIYAKMVAKLRVYYDDAAKSAWKPEGKEAAYANWRAADNFVVPWVGNVSLTLADSPDKLVFTHA
jgi:arylsulfatase B/arylsulfatase I/J